MVGVALGRSVAVGDGTGVAVFAGVEDGSGFTVAVVTGRFPGCTAGIRAGAGRIRAQPASIHAMHNKNNLPVQDNVTFHGLLGSGHFMPIGDPLFHTQVRAEMVRGKITELEGRWITVCNPAERAAHLH